MTRELELGRKQRRRETRRGVIVAERIARTAITLGGMGTILAVGSIFVFLMWVVLPLFQEPEVRDVEAFEAAAPQPWAMGVDEDRLLSWTLHEDGTLELHDLTRGVRVDRTRPFGDDPPTAASVSFGSDAAVFGFADGTVRVGAIGFGRDFLDEEEAPEELRGLLQGESTIHEGGVVTRTPAGQLRRTFLNLELEDPLPAGSAAAVVAVDHTIAPIGLYMVILQADGTLRVSRERVTRNMLTGEETRTLRHAELRAAGDGEDLPRHLGIGGLGQHVYSIRDDGRLEHWDLRQWSAPRLYEELDVLPDPESVVTSVAFVAGKQTLVVGDDRGVVRTFFPARDEDDDASDPLLVPAHTFEQGESEVLDVAASPRSRLIAAAYGSGLVRVFQATLGEQVVECESEEPTRTLLIAPKEDAIVARGETRLWTWEIDFKYPEATLAGLFSAVQYEGYPARRHTWQSSSASDDFEPKLGLMPLVFGTLKATLYSMLFGAPLAILAAIFTSEFLAPRLRSGIKSTVELMASLPSVVLGFVAALVIAPFVQQVLSTVLACFLTVPLAVLFGAYLWQMLPGDRMVRWSGWPRFLAICATLPLGVLLGRILGPLVIERLFFGGDLIGWLAGSGGSALGGWLFLLLPLSTLVVALASTVLVAPRVRARSSSWAREEVARVEAFKFLGGLVAAVVLALLLGVGLDTAGLDPRGSVMGTYIQRNALIVGFAMGFAIVPIIYTLAEDALSEVPSHLREGSLGAGATPWQTAVRIVIPFAMSGLFSALMIGLGRAVGETMIVLMAAGNTPLMEWNVFNGFRTLSANIAVEMPEAVVGSAHYRTLFLAALVLFAMTFVLNTLAELVRRHFRARTRQL